VVIIRNPVDRCLGVKSLTGGTVIALSSI
jgi:hypothetical protein